MKIVLPNSWNGVTIDQFPLIYDILKDKDIQSIDKEIRIISILSNVPVIELERLQIDSLKELINSVNFVFKMDFPKAVEKFTHEAYEWFVNYDITKLSAGDFISISKLATDEDSVMSNIAEITAVFVKPYKRKWFKYEEVRIDYHERMQLIKTLPIGVIYPVALFFCKVMEALHPVIQDYLENELIKANKMANKLIKQSKINI